MLKVFVLLTLLLLPVQEVKVGPEKFKIPSDYLAGTTEKARTLTRIEPLVFLWVEAPEIVPRKDLSMRFHASRTDNLHVIQITLEGNRFIDAATILRNILEAGGGDQNYIVGGLHGLTYRYPKRAAEPEFGVRTFSATLPGGATFLARCDPGKPPERRFCLSTGNKIGRIMYQYMFDESLLPKWREMQERIAERLQSFLVKVN